MRKVRFWILLVLIVIALSGSKCNNADYGEKKSTCSTDSPIVTPVPSSILLASGCLLLLSKRKRR